MGIFICFVRTPQIPEADRPVYFERMMTIFKKGGMLDFETVSIFGHKIHLLHDVEPNARGYVNTCYNYFEDNFWEDAGFSRDGHLGSGKVGSRQFNRVIVAASILMEQMSETKTLVDFRGCAASPSSAAAWLRHILGIKFTLYNRHDCWNVYEIIHKANIECGYPDESITDDELESYLPSHYAKFIEATQYARFWDDDFSTITAHMKEIFEKSYSNPLPGGFTEKMEALPKALRTLQEMRQEDDKTFIKTVLDYLCEPYNERVKKCKENSAPEEASGFMDCEMFLSASLVVKALSEQTGRDFWTLWSMISGKEHSGGIYSMLLEGLMDTYLPISTETYLGINPDDLLYFMPMPDLSREMSEWLEELKSRYESIMAEDFTMRDGNSFLKDIITTLSAVNKHFGHIFMFRETFYEFITHNQEKEYQAVWTLYERIVKEEWGYEKDLVKDWDGYPNTQSRMKVRRFLALLANPTMRQRVFAL